MIRPMARLPAFRGNLPATWPLDQVSLSYDGRFAGAVIDNSAMSNSIGRFFHTGVQKRF